MKVQLLGIGKVREAFYKDGIEEYRKRVEKHLAIRILETPKENSGREGDLMTAYLRVRKEHVGAQIPVACDRGGKNLSSEDLARFFEQGMMDGVGLVSFLVGGPYGLAPLALEDSKLILSLSSMTLPHQMARLLVMEQIYRALAIIHGEPYHK